MRIQVLSSDFPDQLRFFQRPDSGYKSSQSHNFDLYMLFVERVLNLLAPRGTLAMVLPQLFMTSLAGRPLRELLSAAGGVRSIVHFGHEQLFPGRTNYVCLLTVGRIPQDTLTFERVPDLELWKKGEARRPSVERSESITADQWLFVPDQAAEVFSRLRQDFPSTLGAVADVFVGVQTSADNVFLLPTTQMTDEYVEVRTAAGAVHRIERGITRLALRDRKIESYDQRPTPDAIAIFPYEIDADLRKARLIPPDRMALEFPGCWGYLAEHRNQLEQRSLAGGPGETWYRYGRHQSLNRLDRPKVIVRVLSTVPRYAFDPDGLLVPGGGDGGPYYLIRSKTDPSEQYLRYLIGILSHPVIDAMVVAAGRAFRGGYIVHRKANLVGLPIPDPGDALEPIAVAVAAVSDTVVALRNQTDQARRRALETLLPMQRQSVHELISSVYGLSVNELAAFDL